MATYVLIHGAGSDAWYWHGFGMHRRISAGTRELRLAGRRLAPPATGAARGKAMTHHDARWGRDGARTRSTRRMTSRMLIPMTRPRTLTKRRAAIGFRSTKAVGTSRANCRILGIHCHS